MPPPVDLHDLLYPIFDALHESPRTLKSCALVAHSFVHPAQSVLFRHLRIGAPPNGLITALESFPHLLRHIRTLDCDVKALMSADMSRIAWTNLHAVAFRNFPSYAGNQQGPLALERITAFLSENPSIRAVTFSDFYNFPLRALWHIMSNCSPRFNALRLHYVHLGDASLIVGYNVFQPPFKVRRITLAAAGAMDLQVPCMKFSTPEEFSALTHISDAENGLPWASLDREYYINSSLDLTLPAGGMGIAYPSTINLSALTGLTHLELTDRAPWFLSDLDSAAKYIKSIVFLCIYDTPRFLAALRGLEVTLSESPGSLSMLESVLVRVRGSLRGYTSKEVVEFFQRQLPRLHERGLLKVEIT
ncbi:hypothetical protein FB45DRAFT_1030382 [Roridomyces roridus]|uniref:Uncharacterized protein n=1 Tax=Roridomyces roridus TaxID=1738132 RepID=A0AAD7BNM6_9AGAR|nr:hypothetical protein FB45DRAFT_1030382 [Roridomyces roridus]